MSFFSLSYSTSLIHSFALLLLLLTIVLSLSHHQNEFPKNNFRYILSMISDMNVFIYFFFLLAIEKSPSVLSVNKWVHVNSKMYNIEKYKRIERETEREWKGRKLHIYEKKATEKRLYFIIHGNMNELSHVLILMFLSTGFNLLLLLSISVSVSRKNVSKHHGQFMRVNISTPYC